jgi:hypothetical protein
VLKDRLYTAADERARRSARPRLRRSATRSSS